MDEPGPMAIIDGLEVFNETFFTFSIVEFFGS
jgi:hypothetical protein